MLKFVHNGERLKGVVSKSSNVVIQKLQEGTSRDRCFIIGSGYTLNVDDEDRVTWHDPAMIKHEYGLSEDITVYTFYYTYECTGLAEAAEEIASYVNTLFGEYERIYLIGHSKCGLCVCKATEYLDDLAYLVTISTPFDGTVIADQEEMEKRINSKFFLKVYRMIFSNHNVDKDIIPGSDFLKNLKKPACIEHLNFKTKLSKATECKSLVDHFLLFVDRTLKLGGDGVVSYASQEYPADKEVTMTLSHAESLMIGIGVLEKYSKLMK